MKATKTRTARGTSPNPVKSPNGALGIRLGFKACLASVESILSLPGNPPAFSGQQKWS